MGEEIIRKMKGRYRIDNLAVYLCLMTQSDYVQILINFAVEKWGNSDTFCMCTQKLSF